MRRVLGGLRVCLPGRAPRRAVKSRRAAPAQVRQQCGEAYTDEATTRELETIVDKARRAGVIVIQEYEAA